MTLPFSGEISIGDIREGLGTDDGVSLGSNALRIISDNSSGEVALSDFYGLEPRVVESFEWIATGSFETVIFNGNISASSHHDQYANVFKATTPDGAHSIVIDIQKQTSMWSAHTGGLMRIELVPGFKSCRILCVNGTSYLGHNYYQYDTYIESSTGNRIEIPKSIGSDGEYYEVSISEDDEYIEIGHYVSVTQNVDIVDSMHIVEIELVV